MLGPLEPHLQGYGAVGQAKWAAWRRTWRLEEMSDADLDRQVALVAAFVDPVCSDRVNPSAVWDPDTFAWRES